MELVMQIQGQIILRIKTNHILELQGQEQGQME